MGINEKLNSLKSLELKDFSVSLVIVKEYKRKRESHYVPKYVQINEKLENRLKDILSKKIDNASKIEEYSFDCSEPEEDLVRSIDSNETDFQKIIDKVIELNPEEDIVEDVDELVLAKSYLIVLRENDEIKVIGFKTLPENWKMKKAKGFIPLMYKNNRFEDLDDNFVFSISNTLDVLFFDDLLFILSIKSFEAGLNFREGMLTKADEFYKEAEEIKLFVNLDVLSEKVGNNLRYLRKIATIKKKGYYKDQQFLQRFKQVSSHKDWGIEFKDNQIVITENKLDDILSILQNKRLHSEFTDQDFDVNSLKELKL